MNKRNLLLRLGVALMVFGLCVFTAVSYFFAALFIAPARCEIGAPPPDFAFPIHNVSFQTDDELTIKGWYSPAADNRSAIILLHGHKGNRWQMYDTARMLRRAGYGVLLYDARATGESEGETTSVGYYETADLTAAVRFLRERRVEQIACLGQSQGGATILLAAAKLQGVKCVIAQSSYDTILNAIDRRYREYFRIPGWMGGALLIFFAEQKLGIDAEAISPLKEITKLPCPLLLISGSADTRTLAADSERLYDAAPPPKELWMVEGGGHEDLFARTPQEYERRVLTFLAKYLHL